MDQRAFTGQTAQWLYHFCIRADALAEKRKNVISVRVDNSLQPNSRWYSGSGIDRHVWLEATTAVHVANWGVYVTTPAVDSSRATMVVRTMIDNEGLTTANAELTT